MKDGKFDKRSLRLVPWQYKVRHQSTLDFKLNEVVFMKSNPELPMTVHSIEETRVTVMWLTDDGIRTHSFPPQCILQYEYASLLISSKDWLGGNKNFEICLN
jgi:hypothetical protein